MKKIVCLSVLWAVSVSAIGQEPENLAIVKQQVNTYYAPDAKGVSPYDQDTKAVIDSAQAYLMTRVAAAPPGAKLAIVFDIDDTLLWRYPYFKKDSFGYDPVIFEKHQVKDIDPLVPHIKNLYDYALAQHVAIFIITAGCEHVIAKESNNLKKDGIHGWQAIYAKPDAVCHDTSLTSAAFKTAKRQAIVEQGYDIVLSIGDQETDLGQYADKGFKLPNPMYQVK